MKKSVIVLSCVLAVLIAVAVVLLISAPGRKELPPVETVTASSEKATEPAASSAPETTEKVTAEPTTTEPPETTTEPPTEPPLAESNEKITANGVALHLFTEEGKETVLAEAEEYLSALGLLKDGAAHVSDKKLVSVAPDGLSAVIGKHTYDFVSEGKLYVPVYEVAETFGYPVWKDEEEGISYITPGARPFEVPENVNVPVLMYHAVSDNCWGIGELFVSPSSMEEQLKYLVENDYDPIWFEDLAHLEDYDKPVILTFDDGYDDNYTELFPLLKKYQVKVTVFVISGGIGFGHAMNSEQIREMSDSGLVSIQGHGYSHDYMDAMDEETLEFEMSETKKILTEVTGKMPYVLCYPSGRNSSLTREVAQRYYHFGIKMNGGLYNTSHDPFLVNRYYISRYTDIYGFASMISAAGT